MMKRLSSVLMAMAASTFLFAEDIRDSLSLEEVVVTGTRSATDVRHLPMTVNVIGRASLTEQHQTSVLPTVMQQVPGLFVTSRRREVWLLIFSAFLVNLTAICVKADCGFCRTFAPSNINNNLK